MKNFIIPVPDSIDPRNLSEYLLQSVWSFVELTGITVTYFDADHTLIREFSTGSRPCHELGLYDDPASQCRQALASATKLTSRLGEPYIFLCQAGLTNIAVSLIDSGRLLGCFIAGPIAMGGIRKGTIRRFRNLNELHETSDESCRQMLSNVPVYPPRKIFHLAFLFYNCILSAVSEEEGYLRLRLQSSSQSDLSDSIRASKRDGQNAEYPYALEAALVEHVKNGELQQVTDDMEQLLHTFSVLETGDLEGIRTKILWLFAMILRTATEREQELNMNWADNLDVINLLSDARDFEELSSRSIRLVRSITENMISRIYKGNSRIVTEALRYIHRNYRRKLTLQEISDELHVNQSYFSSLFRQEIGMTFTEYLNQLRVGFACRLLTGTNLPIIEIANASGFEDQSYFTRIFRRYTDTTPHNYRKTTR